MSGRIPQSFIDDLIGRTDIVELVGARVPLKKSGREFKACCPFHDEKSPSFWVSPDKQFYHCFGCGAHGTSLGFLMNYDRLSFPEAVEELAARAGIEVPREARADEARGRSDDLTELMGRVARHYAETLRKTPRAHDYAMRRGLDAEILARFMVGYAADSWNDVLQKFGNGTEKRDALLACGLVIEGERTYDQIGRAHV